MQIFFTKNLVFLTMTIALVTGACAALPAHAAEYRVADVEEQVQKLYSDNQEDRASAGEKLSEIGPEAKSAVPRLIEILQTDPVMSVRGEAAKALGAIGKGASAAQPALRVFLKSPDGGLERAYAATALGEIGAQPEESVALLTEILKADDDNQTVRQLCARALGNFGAQASSSVPALISTIKTGNKELRDAAADGLSQIPATKQNVAELSAILTDELDIARSAACKALCGAGPDAAAAVPQLMKLLSDKNFDVRAAAISTLGSIGVGAKAAVPSLRLAEKDAFLKKPAEEAIEKIRAR